MHPWRCYCTQAGGDIHLLHVVFAGYLCLSSIIMLNLLIAMMNTTYSMVSSTRATAWRVESLRTALWFERKMPLLKSSMFLRFKTRRRVVDDRPRWYITYIPEQVTSYTMHADVRTPCVDYKFIQRHSVERY